MVAARSDGWIAGNAPGQIARAIRAMILAHADMLYRRSKAAARFFETRMEILALAWLCVFVPVAVLKVCFAVSPVHGLADLAALAVPYLLIGFAPLAGFAVASGSFPRRLLCGQPGFRFAVFGKWRRLDVMEVRSNPAFGPVGFMASLLIGMLLNVVVRSFEFMLAVPAMNGHAPEWGQMLFLLMAADTMVMNFFYMVAFVMALRAIPLFPRMLLFIWVLDIAIQLTIARSIAAISGLPWQVAMPLRDLLEGNVTKVLISAALWLPYLILSERVNVTYRHRAAR